MTQATDIAGPAPARSGRADPNSILRFLPAFAAIVVTAWFSNTYLSQAQEHNNRPMEIPRLEKVVVQHRSRRGDREPKGARRGGRRPTTITGQKPIVTRAKRSIAQFRLRTGMPIGAKVTLRGQRMYDFLERTLSLALPRIRDFRGIPTRSFDGRGNFSLGLREQLVYPEIDYDKIDRLRGLEISIVTTARTDEEGRKLLELLGMPFQAS